MLLLSLQDTPASCSNFLKSTVGGIGYSAKYRYLNGWFRGRPDASCWDSMPHQSFSGWELARLRFWVARFWTSCSFCWRALSRFSTCFLLSLLCCCLGFWSCFCCWLFCFGFWGGCFFLSSSNAFCRLWRASASLGSSKSACLYASMLSSSLLERVSATPFIVKAVLY